MRCPRCAEPVEVDGRSLRCVHRHSFDLARQGYVNLLSRPAGAAADDAAMVAARQEILASGLYAPLTDGLAAAARALDLPPGVVVDVGAGTGHHTAAVLEALPDRIGIALDLSVYAARRAARAHPRLAALVDDVWEGLPVADGTAALVVDVFAPRNVAEFDRVLAPGGAVLVVTPAPTHLTELVTELDMPRVDPRKAERLAETFARYSPGPIRRVRETLHVPGPVAAAVARMGPGAHHVSPAALDALSAGAGEVEVTFAVDVSTFLRA
ncbi:putative RNA methyltransferase [Mobilicoccus pelagius]|uniref:putative RNA methyltransferase n=1 Tax=Mobilicoccus pelagius TaxID=746032 RepID=UPI000590FB6C